VKGGLVTAGKQNTEPLKPIVGRQLSAVVFVQDYVQLQFDGPSLTAITWPVVTTENTEYAYGQPLYRDILCERITKAVHSASIKEGEEIRINFNDGSVITISLKPDSYSAAEAAIFADGPENTWVW
jgi:hypothetical protein